MDHAEFHARRSEAFAGRARLRVDLAGYGPSGSRGCLRLRTAHDARLRPSRGAIDRLRRRRSAGVLDLALPHVAVYVSLSLVPWGRGRAGDPKPERTHDLRCALGGRLHGPWNHGKSVRLGRIPPGFGFRL